VSKYEIESWQCGRHVAHNSFEDREMVPPLDKISQDERKSYKIYFSYSKIEIHLIRKHAGVSYE